LAAWQISLEVNHTNSIVRIDTPKYLTISDSSTLHASLDWTPTSSLHVVSLNTFSVEDEVFFIESNDSGLFVVSNTFTPVFIIGSNPSSTSMIILGHTLSVLHLSISINAPNIIFYTVDKSMSVRRGVFLVFHLEPVAGHFDSVIVESSPFQGFNSSVVSSLVTRIKGPKTISIRGSDFVDVTEYILP